MKRILLEQQTHGEKQTPMHYAAKSGSLDAISALRQDEDATDLIFEARDYQGIFFLVCFWIFFGKKA
jgi:hypothetical protein